MPAAETPPNGRRLESWKEIAAYLNREVRTAMRWEKERGLPVHRIPGKRSGVYALASEVEAWLRAGEVGPSNGGMVPEASPPVPQAKSRKPAVWMVASATLLLLGIALALLVFSVTKGDAPRLRNPVAITNDGLLKDRLIFGGRTRFTVSKDGERWKLVRTPANGGASSAVVSWSPGGLYLLDVSSDESEVLVARNDSFTCPCPLWVVPTASGPLRRLANVTANYAAWSPDGKTLAYANGRDVYLASHDGNLARRITTLPRDVETLCWSPSGKRLRLTIGEGKPISESIRLWDVDLVRPIPRPVLRGWSHGRRDLELSGRWMPSGDFFVFAAVHDGAPGLFAIPERPLWYDNSGATPIQLTTTIEGVNYPTPSPDGKKIFAIVQAPPRGELVRYEPKARQFVTWPSMQGPSAGHVAFSPDGRAAVYVSYPEENLWRMKSDGTEKQQLTFGTSRAAAPRWSPDGRRISFMGWNAGTNDASKIRIIPAQGGPISEPVRWPGWHGIPTWTPDGTGLIFGENAGFFPIQATCSLHRFDFKTGKTADLPGTTGLWTARACPTGRYVAATTRDQRKLVLYDMKTARVTSLASFRDSVVGDNPTWSEDGSSIYIDAPQSPDAAIYRVRIADKYTERVASLKDIQRANMGYWIGLTPDGALLVTRRVQGSEIYAWDWEWVAR